MKWVQGESDHEGARANIFIEFFSRYSARVRRRIFLCLSNLKRNMRYLFPYECSCR
jgi:hypothetical protein